MDKNCLRDMIEEHEDTIRGICRKYASSPGSLISILNDVQEDFGYLPIQVQEIVAEETGIALSEIYGVTTFYSRFSLTPIGKHKISVCLGTACYVKGSQAILDSFSKALDVEVGGTTADNQFTLDSTRCVGACGLAPVCIVDGQTFGNSKPGDVEDIIAQYSDKEDAN